MPGGPRSLPSRTALKQLICGQPQQEGHALAQVRWVIPRFRDAGEPAWAAPDDDELRQHFDDQLLTAVLAGELSSRRAITARTAHSPLRPTRTISALLKEE
jgi:hypothetical protein